MEAWSNDDVCRWLAELQLSEHVPRVRQMQLNGIDLKNVTDQQLSRDLLITDMRHRLAILRGVKKILEGFSVSGDQYRRLGYVNYTPGVSSTPGRSEAAANGPSSSAHAYVNIVPPLAGGSLTPAALPATGQRAYSNVSISNTLQPPEENYMAMNIVAAPQDICMVAMSDIHQPPVPPQDHYVAMTDTNQPHVQENYMTMDDALAPVGGEIYTDLGSANVPTVPEELYSNIIDTAAPSPRTSRSSVGPTFLRSHTPVPEVSLPPTPGPPLGPRHNSCASYGSSATTVPPSSPAIAPSTQGEDRSLRRNTKSEPVKGISARELMKEDPRCTGFVQKQGGSIKSWKLRFVILLRGCVYYYSHESSASAKGEFSLHGYRVEDAPERKRPFPFKLVNDNPKCRTWYFSVSNETDRANWMKLLRVDIKEFCSANQRVIPRQASIKKDSNCSDSDGSDIEAVYDQPYDDSLFHESKPTPAKETLIPAAAVDGSKNTGPAVSFKRTPSASIVLDDSEPMERASWFLQGTDRLQAELLLCKQGQWLVRQKAGDTTSVLSVLWAGKPRHYKLFFLPDKGYSTGGNSCVFFTTVVGLLQFYMKEPLPKSDIILKEPFGAD